MSKKKKIVKDGEFLASVSVIHTDDYAKTLSINKSEKLQRLLYDTFGTHEKDTRAVGGKVYLVKNDDNGKSLELPFAIGEVSQGILVHNDEGDVAFNRAMFRTVEDNTTFSLSPMSQQDTRALLVKAVRELQRFYQDMVTFNREYKKVATVEGNDEGDSSVEFTTDARRFNPYTP